MELVKIESLLDAYFEGNTSLKEEKVLRNYFNSEKVAPHLLQYKPIFVGFEVAKKESLNMELLFPEKKPTHSKAWLYSVAAMIIVALAVGGFYISQPRLTQEEQEALAAFEKSKETMFLLSENLNKGAEQLTLVDQFTVTKNKFLK